MIAIEIIDRGFLVLSDEPNIKIVRRNYAYSLTALPATVSYPFEVPAEENSRVLDWHSAFDYKSTAARLPAILWKYGSPYTEGIIEVQGEQEGKLTLQFLAEPIFIDMQNDMLHNLPFMNEEELMGFSSDAVLAKATQMSRRIDWTQKFCFPAIITESFLQEEDNVIRNMVANQTDPTTGALLLRIPNSNFGFNKLNRIIPCFYLRYLLDEIFKYYGFTVIFNQINLDLLNQAILTSNISLNEKSVSFQYLATATQIVEYQVGYYHIRFDAFSLTSYLKFGGQLWPVDFIEIMPRPFDDLRQFILIDRTKDFIAKITVTGTFAPELSCKVLFGSMNDSTALFQLEREEVFTIRRANNSNVHEFYFAVNERTQNGTGFFVDIFFPNILNETGETDTEIQSVSLTVQSKTWDPDDVENDIFYNDTIKPKDFIENITVAEFLNRSARSLGAYIDWNNDLKTATFKPLTSQFSTPPVIANGNVDIKKDYFFPEGFLIQQNTLAQQINKETTVFSAIIDSFLLNQLDTLSPPIPIVFYSESLISGVLELCTNNVIDPFKNVLGKYFSEIRVGDANKQIKQGWPVAEVNGFYPSGPAENKIPLFYTISTPDVKNFSSRAGAIKNTIAIYNGVQNLSFSSIWIGFHASGNNYNQIGAKTTFPCLSILENDPQGWQNHFIRHMIIANGGQRITVRFINVPWMEELIKVDTPIDIGNNIIIIPEEIEEEYSANTTVFIVKGYPLTPEFYEQFS